MVNKMNVKSKNISIIKKELKQDAFLYIILSIPLIHVLIFRYVPMFGTVIAFQDYNIVGGIFKSEWAGLKWFVKFITDDNFWRLIRNTILISAYSLFWGFPAPIIFALLLNEVDCNYFKKIVQTSSYLPFFISTVIVVGMIFQILSPTTGVVNIILSKVFGLKPIMFMTKTEWFRTIYVVSGIWQSMGYSSILYLAALTNIDIELYEAATIDGAGRFGKMLYIAIPGILPTIVVLFLLSVGNILYVGFEKILLMSNPLVVEISEVIDTYVYKRGLVGLDFSYSTAVGLFQSGISFILVVSANKISKTIAEISLW